MKYKDVPPGTIFRLFSILPTGSQTQFCLKLQTGAAADVATGEIIHIHPAKTVEIVGLRQSGRIGVVKDRPCIVSAASAGRKLCEYFVIVGSELIPESRIHWHETEANRPTFPREVNIILAGIIYVMRTCLKLLQSQADTLEGVLEVDIITGTEKIMPPTTKKRDSG
jgi:hypothetical protein